MQMYMCAANGALLKTNCRRGVFKKLTQARRFFVFALTTKLCPPPLPSGHKTTHLSPACPLGDPNSGSSGMCVFFGLCVCVFMGSRACAGGVGDSEEGAGGELSLWNVCQCACVNTWPTFSGWGVNKWARARTHTCGVHDTLAKKNKKIPKSHANHK